MHPRAAVLLVLILFFSLEQEIGRLQRFLITRVFVLSMLASLPVGANVYLMSRQFETKGGAIAASLVLSTALGAATTPLLLALATALSS